MAKIGETIYYRRESWSFVQKSILYGETSRSWIIGEENAWFKGNAENIAKYGTKISKKCCVIETPEAYAISRWALDHRYKIKEAVDHATPEQLKKVAEIIGYPNTATDTKG